MESRRDCPLTGSPSPIRMHTYSIVKGGKTVVSGVVRRVDLVVGQGEHSHFLDSVYSVLCRVGPSVSMRRNERWEREVPGERRKRTAQRITIPKPSLRKSNGSDG